MFDGPNAVIDDLRFERPLRIERKAVVGRFGGGSLIVYERRRGVHGSSFRGNVSFGHDAQVSRDPTDGGYHQHLEGNTQRGQVRVAIAGSKKGEGLYTVNTKQMKPLYNQGMTFSRGIALTENLNVLS